MDFSQLQASELADLLEKEQKVYKKFQNAKLQLDMSRGKPCIEQLDIGREMLDTVNSSSVFTLASGGDARNYGGLDGIAELKELFGQLLGAEKERVLLFDESSLQLMYLAVAFAKEYGLSGEMPWSKQGKVKFLCPVPGYDRHFGVCQALGIDMVSVPMKDDGPDMDIVEQLVATDAQIKGIWCVPKYSNPQGIVYSDVVVDRLAKMKTAAKDFRIFWDNAYFTHFLYETDVPLKNILTAADEAGNSDRVYMFASTSKITFAGAGVAAFVTSESNLEEFKSHLKYMTIGPNKLNQLMHLRYLKSAENVKLIMTRHAEILRPKFEAVQKKLFDNFENGQIVSWTKPLGGYFISLNLLEGSAKRAVQLAKDAGVIFTPAGATYPLGNDDSDANIRIAPSYPPIKELDSATDVLVNALKIAALESLIAKQD